MSIYNLTESIVNLSNEEEAKNKLLDSNILLLNNHEYYKTIISSFIQKKESIIKKENDKLVFDLNNTNDIWNIIFIGEYIKENDLLYRSYNELLLRISDIECNLSLIKDKHKGVTSQEAHKLINEEYQIVNTELRKCKTQLDNMKPVLEAFYNTDWVNLTNSNESIDSLKETKVLKQAINIIHKVRNSFEHDNPEINSNIHINNDSFNFSIPIEYLDGFNKGRIIANNKDDVIVEKTNLITLPLLEELNCDINDIQSLFYNIDPELLSMLLKETNYNVKDLFRLSKRVLYEEGPRTKEILKAGYGIDIIEKISNVICSSPFLSAEQIIETLNYLKSNNLLDNFITINPAVYGNTKVLDYYIKSGVDLEIFRAPYFKYRGNLEYAKKYVNKIKSLEKKGISYTKLIKRFSNEFAVNEIFETDERIIEVKQLLDDYNIPSEVLYDRQLLIDEFLKTPEKFNKIIDSINSRVNVIESVLWYTISPYGYNDKNSNWIVDILKKYKIESKYIGRHGDSFEILKTYLIQKEIYPYKEEYKKLYIVIEYLRIMEYYEKSYFKSDDCELLFRGVSELFDAGLSIEEIESLSIYTIEDYQKVIYLYNNNIPLDIIKKIKFYLVDDLKEIIDFSNYLKEKNIPMDLIKNDFWNKPKEVTRFINNIPKGKMEIINNLNYRFVYDVDKIVSCINYLINNNIDIFRISSFLIEEKDKTIDFIEWLKHNNYDLKILEKLPDLAFNKYRSPEDDLIIDRIEYRKLRGIAIEYETLESPKNVVDFLVINGYTVDKEMPKKIFLVPACKKENLEYLLKLVNYDFRKLDEFPVEFYTCDYELLDTMCKNYNYNLCMSLFGLDNPKIIVSLIYGNSVYSQYQKELDDNTLIDIDPMTIIHAGFNNTMYYKDNIKNESFNEESYLRQFMYDENNQKRSSEDLKRYLLDKLRNSLAHFRFKPVLDKEGKIVDGMIYIYDSYNESDEHNFDLIIDIKDFVEITRQVELGLLKKKNESFEEDNRFKTR